MGQGSSTHPIHSAGRTGDVVVVRRYLKNLAILNRRDSDDMTCLHWAAQLGHIEIIQALIGAKVDLNAQDGNGWTPLMHACCRGHKLVVGALLAARACVDTESCDGRTALHRAATWKRIGPLDQLIEAGGDVRHKAYNMWTPLHCAAAAGDSHACVLLMEAGADPGAEDIDGLKPIDVIADLSSAERVTQALTQGRRRVVSNLECISASAKLAKHSPERPPLPSSSAADTNRVQVSSAPFHPFRVSESEKLCLGAATVDNKAESCFGKDKEHKHLDSTVLLPALKTSEVGEIAAVESRRDRGKSEEVGMPLRKRGSWSRPTALKSRPRGSCGDDGSVDGLRESTLTPLNNPSSERKRRSSNKVVVTSDEGQIETQIRDLPDRELDKEKVNEGSVDANRAASVNNAQHTSESCNEAENCSAVEPPENIARVQD